MAQEHYNELQARMKQKETFYYWPLQVAYQAFERSYLSPADWGTVEADIYASMASWDHGSTEEDTGATMTDKAIQFAADMVRDVQNYSGSFAHAKYYVQKQEAAELERTARSLANERRDLMALYEASVNSVDDGHCHAAEVRDGWADNHYADSTRSPWRTTSGAAFLEPRDYDEDEAEAAYDDGEHVHDPADDEEEEEEGEESDSTGEDDVEDDDDGEEEEDEEDSDQPSDMEFSSDQDSD